MLSISTCALQEGIIGVNQLMLETVLDGEQQELAWAYTRPLFGLT